MVSSLSRRTPRFRTGSLGTNGGEMEAKDVKSRLGQLLPRAKPDELRLGGIQP